VAKAEKATANADLAHAAWLTHRAAIDRIKARHKNPRQNGSYYAATYGVGGDTAYGIGTSAAAALRDAKQWFDGDTGSLSVDRISRARYLAIKGGNPTASGTRKNGGMTAVWSPVNQAWIVLYGDTPIRLGTGRGNYYPSKTELKRDLTTLGLKLTGNKITANK
jgi:hypothetical protein